MWLLARRRLSSPLRARRASAAATRRSAEQRPTSPRASSGQRGARDERSRRSFATERSLSSDNPRPPVPHARWRFDLLHGSIWEEAVVAALLRPLVDRRAGRLARQLRALTSTWPGRASPHTQRRATLSAASQRLDQCQSGSESARQ